MTIAAKLARFPYKFVCIVGTAYLVGWFLGGLHPSTWDILLLPLLFILLGGLLLNLFKFCVAPTSPDNRQKDIAAVRMFICLAVLLMTIVAARAGHYLKTRIFLYELPRYQRAVDKIILENKLRPSGAYSLRIPSPDPSLFPSRPLLVRTENGVLLVDFMTDAWGFPPRHAGYIYLPEGDPSGLRSTLDYQDLVFTRVAPHWYRWDD